MRLFWRKGYEATSTSDLVSELGIARQSLYGAFGSKRALYLASLYRFNAAGAGAAALELLASRESPLQAVREFLLISALPAPTGEPDGCFSVNATAENGDMDPEVSRRLESARRRLETALHAALLLARAEGELAAGVDPRSAATMLVALNTGLKVLARAGSDQRPRIEASVDAVLAGLAAPRRSS